MQNLSGSLTCTFLLIYLKNTDNAAKKNFRYLMDFMSDIPSVLMNWFIRTGSILTVIFHSILFKYKGRFYNGKKTRNFFEI